VHPSIVCPRCEGELSEGAERLRCDACGAEYKYDGGVAVLLSPDSDVYKGDQDRIRFWDEGWRARCAEEMTHTREQILERKRAAEQFRKDYGMDQLNWFVGLNTPGSTILNIGCGGGAREALGLIGCADNYVGVDTSLFAAQSTQVLLQRAGFSAIAVQGEGEKLPFRSESFEMIYTSGVLHHTPRTEDAIREVYRVLKPGGKAVIGLYATHSIHFWNYRLRAALHGNFSNSAYGEWLHANTEGGWNTEGRKNRWTTTYTRASFAEALKAAGFISFEFDQMYASILDFPVLGRIAPKVLPKSLLDKRLVKFGGILYALCAKPRG